MIAIVLRLVLDHRFPEDPLQLALEAHIVDVLEVLNDVIIVLPQVQAHQTGVADHPPLLHEILDGLPKEPLEPLLDVLRLLSIQRELILHKLQRETLVLVRRLVETVHPVLNRRTEIETRPDQHHENDPLYDL